MIQDTRVSMILDNTVSKDTTQIVISLRRILRSKVALIKPENLVVHSAAVSPFREPDFHN